MPNEAAGDLGALDGALAEIATTREKADRIAKEGMSEGADPSSVLAGLIAQLAQQTERLCRALTGPGAPASRSGQQSPTSDVQPSPEEDVAPETSPARPASDPYEATGETDPRTSPVAPR
jgi:hypothetical protein